jgi:hypothetical protein
MLQQILHKIAAIYFYFMLWLGNYHVAFILFGRTEVNYELIGLSFFSSLAFAYTSGFTFLPKFLVKKNKG